MNWKLRTSLVVVMVTALGGARCACAQNRDVDDTVRKGLDWLAYTQHRLGHWSAEGRYQLADAPAGEGSSFGALIPEHVEVNVRGGQVRYYDAARGEAWIFDGVAMSLTRTAAMLAIEARAAPATGLAESLELTVDADLGDGSGRDTRWRVASELEDVDVAALARLLPTETVYAVAGTGDAAFSIERVAGRIEHATANLDLESVVLPGAEDEDVPTFDRVALTADWKTNASGGWRLALNGVDLARRGRHWPVQASSTIEIELRDGAVNGITAQSDFVRLDDFAPIIRALAPDDVVTRWNEFAARGDLRDLDLALAREVGDSWTTSLGLSR